LKKSLEKIKALRKRTKIILGAVLIIVILVLIPILKPSTPTYETGIVERGDVIQEISANGTVQSTDEIDLRFKTSGTIDRILTKVGNSVKKRTYLVSLDSGAVYSQYLQAQANYNQAKAKLDQLIAGASIEEIKVGEQVLENARVALEDAKAKATNDLNQDYNSALVYLVSASNKCNKAITDLDDMEKTYFYDSSAITRIFKEKKGLAEEAFLGILSTKGAQELAEIAVDNPTHENIDSALSKMWIALQKTSDALEYTKTAMSDPTIRSSVASADKTTINSDATDIDSAFTNINSSQTNIADQKITNQVNINTAESTYSKAKVDLDELKAPPRGVDIAVYQADVDKYRASLTEYADKLRDASIIAPFDGVVAKIDAKIGEVITAGEKTIVTLISPSGFQLELDVPETDISKISMDDPVIIAINAIQEITYPGQILEIESGKTIIDGVVYYKVIVLFEGDKQKIKSGMTGDATIQTDKKENVLNVPQRAIISKNGSKYIRVLESGNITERKVTTGLRGNKGEIEIISGLEEGEEIITFMKSGK